MLTLRDIMVTELTAVTPDMTLQDVVEIFAANGITGAPVVAGGRVAGVISARDIIDFGAVAPGAPARRDDQREWGDWEASEPETAAEYFTDLYGTPGADVLERFRSGDGPEWNVLAEHTVSEAMTSELNSLAPDATIKEAAGYMIDAGVHRVLVLEDGVLAGLATATDIVKAVARHGLGA